MQYDDNQNEKYNQELIYQQNKKYRQNSSNKKKAKTGTVFSKNILIILLCTALILAIGYPLWVSYTDRMMAHQALREAKNVQLSMHLLSSQYYGEGTTPKSTATVSGLKKSAETEILKLAGADDCKIRVLSWNADNYEPVAFEYTTGNYFVTYSQTDTGDNLWEVSKINKLLTFS